MGLSGLMSDVFTKDFTPKYVKLASLFKDKIINGELPHNTKLPTNRTLAKNYSVSLQTANKALKLLARQRLIVPAVGDGTYVSYHRETEKTIRKVALVGTAFGQGFRSPYPYYTQLLGGLHDFFLNNNLIAVKTTASEKNFFKEFNDGEFDGVVFTSPGKKWFPVINDVAKSQIPYVVISGGREGMIRITTDNVGGSRKAVDYLVRLGHSRIAFLGLDAKFFSNERQEGYKIALKANRIKFDEDLSCMVPPGSGNAKKTLDALFSLKEPPTAIFAAGFHLAVKAFRYMQLSGIKIPDDVSLLSFDDFEMIYNYFVPAVTAVKQNIFELGSRGAEILLNQMLGNRNVARETVLPTEINVRESCSSPNK